MTAISPASRRRVRRSSTWMMQGKGLPVIFQHGLCGDARQTIEAFPRDPRFRRITIESRGHGGSEAGDPSLFSVRTFASDVATFIDTHRLAPIIVGGISMGAAISLHLAVHRPGIVRGLILARPAWIAATAQLIIFRTQWLVGFSRSYHRKMRERPLRLARSRGFSPRKRLIISPL